MLTEVLTKRRQSLRTTSRAGEGTEPLKPIAPMETNPATAKTKNGALQACSVKAKIGSRTPAISSGPPRQPPT